MTNRRNLSLRTAICALAAFAFSPLMTAVAQPPGEGDGARRGRPEFRDRGDRGGDRGPRDGQGGPGGRFGGRFGGGPGGPGGPGGGPEMIMRLPVMAALDADGDGVISTKEMENAAVALKKLDGNQDGKLDASEIMPQRPGGFGDRGPGGPGGDRGPGGFGDRGPGGPGGRGQGGQGGPGGRGGDPTAMIDRLMQQDKDGDGKLSGDELPQQLARMVERADADGDGKLSKEEITKAMEARMQMMRGGGGQRGAGQRGGQRGGGDAPGGERPRRPPVEE